MYVIEVERERLVVYFEFGICQKYLAASPAIAKRSAPLKDAMAVGTLAMPRPSLQATDNDRGSGKGFNWSSADNSFYILQHLVHSCAHVSSFENITTPCVPPFDCCNILAESLFSLELTALSVRKPSRLCPQYGMSGHLSLKRLIL